MSQVEIEDKGGGRFALRGRMDFDTVTGALESSAKLFADHAEVDVDMSEVETCDSAGLALLIEWVAAARRAKQKLCFRNIPEQVRALARISEVDSLLPRC